MDIQIYNYLILTTTKTTPEEWEKVVEFLSYKKRKFSKTRLITTSGRESFTKINNLWRELENKRIPCETLGLMSCPEPADIRETYKRLSIGLSFQYYDDGLLLLSDSPLEDLLKPIQIYFKFVDDDLGIDNNELLAEYVLKLRSSPNLLIYDARSTIFMD